MDKSQFYHSFWSRFGWPAFDETTVPDRESGTNVVIARLPYITYMVITDEHEYPIYPEASLWAYGTNWDVISQKAQEISEYIGYGGRTEKIDGGRVWIQRGHPFAQRLSDANDMVRRIMINIELEFLTRD